MASALTDVFHAVEEAIIALVRLYQRYTFTLAEELLTGPLEVKQGITMSPKHGVPLQVVLRRSTAQRMQKDQVGCQ